jgi:transcription initiation factor IIE alpha subunit
MKAREWIAVYSCKNCKGILSRGQVMDSNGVCPLCGNTVAGSIVDVYKTSILTIRKKAKGWRRFFSCFDEIAYE